MALLTNIFLILALIFLIIIILLHHQKKKSKKGNLEDCYNNCNNNCDENHPAVYYDVCKKRCAISCGDDFN